MHMCFYELVQCFCRMCWKAVSGIMSLCGDMTSNLSHANNVISLVFIDVCTVLFECSYVLIETDTSNIKVSKAKTMVKKNIIKEFNGIKCNTFVTFNLVFWLKKSKA